MQTLSTWHQRPCARSPVSRTVLTSKSVGVCVRTQTQVVHWGSLYVTISRWRERGRERERLYGSVSEREERVCVCSYMHIVSNLHKWVTTFVLWLVRSYTDDSHGNHPVLHILLLLLPPSYHLLVRYLTFESILLSRQTLSVSTQIPSIPVGVEIYQSNDVFRQEVDPRVNPKKNIRKDKERILI